MSDDIICMADEEDAELRGEAAALRIDRGRGSPYFFHYPELKGAEDIGYDTATEFLRDHGITG